MIAKRNGIRLWACSDGSVNWYYVVRRYVSRRFAEWFWDSALYHSFCRRRNPGCNTCWRRREGIE